MKCSNISRCDNFKLINIDNNFLCLTCYSIFKKNKKFLNFFYKLQRIINDFNNCNSKWWIFRKIP